MALVIFSGENLVLLLSVLLFGRANRLRRKPGRSSPIQLIGGLRRSTDGRRLAADWFQFLLHNRLREVGALWAEREGACRFHQALCGYGIFLSGAALTNCPN